MNKQITNDCPSLITDLTTTFGTEPKPFPNSKTNKQNSQPPPPIKNKQKTKNQGSIKKRHKAIACQASTTCKFSRKEMENLWRKRGQRKHSRNSICNREKLCTEQNVGGWQILFLREVSWLDWLVAKYLIKLGHGEEILVLQKKSLTAALLTTKKKVITLEQVNKLKWKSSTSQNEDCWPGRLY